MAPLKWHPYDDGGKHYRLAFGKEFDYLLRQVPPSLQWQVRKTTGPEADKLVKHVFVVTEEEAKAKAQEWEDE